MLAEQGITRDNIDEAELNNTQSAERIADGQLDAYFYAAGTPVAAMIQLDNTKGMDLYSFSAVEVIASNKAVPYYVPSTIKRWAPTRASSTTSTPWLCSGILATSIDQDEELIYEVTKALWNKTTRKLLDTGHAKGKVIRLETALKGISGLSVPLHPGAERYYKEVGPYQIRGSFPGRLAPAGGVSSEAAGRMSVATFVLRLPVKQTQNHQPRRYQGRR